MGPLDFFKVAVRDYKNVGAVTASSKYAVRRVIRRLKPGYKCVVEYGAGSGVITKEILKRLPSDGSLVAIELNESLFKELSRIRDRRLTVLNRDVIEFSRERFLRIYKPDAIISGIPFSFMPRSDRVEVVMNTSQALSEGGRFILYQTSPMMSQILKDNFQKVRQSLEMRNLPPYFIITAEK